MNLFGPGYPSGTPQISQGQLKQVRLISLSHGIIRPNMGDTLELTPNQSYKSIDEFDNLYHAVHWQQFDQITGKYGYKASNVPMVDALLMDADPTAGQVIVDPAVLRQFHLLVNDRGFDGRIFQSYFVEGCIPMGPGSSSAVKDAQTLSLDFNAIRMVKLQGRAMLYTRVRKNGAARLAAPAAPTIAHVSTGGNIADGAYYVSLTGVTANGETDASPQAGIIVDDGTGTSTINVTIPALGSFTGYHVYMGDSQGTLRRVTATPVTVGPVAITAIPPLSNVVAPTENTTGPHVQVLAASGAPGNAGEDQEWAASSPYEVTLEKPAVFIHNPLWYDRGVILALKNGNPVDDGFVLSTDGTTIEIGPTAPAQNDVWEFITAYDPAA